VSLISNNSISITTHTIFLQLWIPKKGQLLILFLRLSKEPKLKRIFYILWVFLRKSQFSTLNDLNPGFGIPRNMLAIFFVNVIFIMLQKKSFGQNNFWISCIARVQKCHLGNFSILAKCHFWMPCMKFKNCFDQKTSFEA
jgi:hypothetical protein